MKSQLVPQIVESSGRMASAYLTWSHAVQLLVAGTLANQYMTNTQISVVQKDVECVKKDVERLQRNMDRLSDDVRQLSSEVREVLQNRRRSWW